MVSFSRLWVLLFLGLSYCASAPKPVVPDDRDHDGVIGKDDRCPNVPEDRDGYLDYDGCPDDDDQDGIPDASDRCRKVPGKPSNQGCPIHVRVEDKAIIILDGIRFETDSAELSGKVQPAMDEIALVLRFSPQIKNVCIEGHADDRGSDEYNLELSQRRAETVRTWLAKNNIAIDRMAIVGYGKVQPRVSGVTDEARYENRRVEIRVLDDSATATCPTPAQEAPPTAEAGPKKPEDDE